MSLKEKMKRFDQRWNLPVNNGDSFRKFKTGILNIFQDIDLYVHASSIEEFCLYYGIEDRRGEDIYGRKESGDNIIRSLRIESNEIYFFRLIEVIFSLNIPGVYSGSSVEYTKGSFYKKVCQAIDFSNINLATTTTKDREIIFYPKGEEILDEDLVNNVLSFLDKKSNDHFIEGLNFYSDKKWIKSAESLRRSLEEFLRIKLKNKAGSKANILEISKKLKDEKSPAQARNIIVSSFNFIDQYFNEESKHKDGDLEENEAEFLIYQIALLMRYINKQI